MMWRAENNERRTDDCDIGSTSQIFMGNLSPIDFWSERPDEPSQDGRSLKTKHWRISPNLEAVAWCICKALDHKWPPSSAMDSYDPHKPAEGYEDNEDS
jgi:hypothetical protein